MEPKALFVVLSTLAIPAGIGITGLGIAKINDSGYSLDEINHGFVFSAIWVGLGVVVFWQWLIWFSAHLISFVRAYRTEQFMMNCGMLAMALIFIVTGILSMDSNPLYLNVCECKPDYWGIHCDDCPGLGVEGGICNGHGACDDGVMGVGTCTCDQGYVGTNCTICAIHYTRDFTSGDCVCERVWTGEKCEIEAPGFDNSQYPYVFCKRGWTQTESIPTTDSAYWTYPTNWPVCGKCSAYHGGHPDVECKPCLGWNGSLPMNDDNVCNGHGSCWHNEAYEKHVWDCSGTDCMAGIPEGGIKNQCTPSWDICEIDTDCPGTFNCAGRCRSLYGWPNGPTEAWDKEFNGVVCRENDECNFMGNPYIGSILPAGWDTEGECTERTCCSEPKRGNATCYNCRGNDTYVDGVRTEYGPIVMGRFPPACDECPGWDNDIDVNGQTICNGKGTCNPMYDVFNEYTGMECKCQTDIETGSTWRGEFCECLATSIYSETCQKCVQGFYLPADIDASLLAGNAVEAQTACLMCPGSENGTGVAACNWKKGLGSCIYADAIGERKEDEPNAEYQIRLMNAGKCGCSTQLLDIPTVAAKGAMCDEAPPNFYKMEIGSDWFMMSCPRTLPLGVEVCASFAPQYIWDYIGSDGTPRQACTQSCGGKPIEMTMCVDELSQKGGYLEQYYSGEWNFLDGGGAVIPSKIEQKGVCYCNGNDMLPDPTMEAHYYRGANGLCTKSKVKY